MDQGDANQVASVPKAPNPRSLILNVQGNTIAARAVPRFIGALDLTDRSFDWMARPAIIDPAAPSVPDGSATVSIAYPAKRSPLERHAPPRRTPRTD